MWGDVDEETGSKREQELKNVFWKSMVERGTSVRRFLHNRNSALDVLGPIFDEINKKSALLIQQEVTELGLQLNQTTAGKALYKELAHLVSQHESVLKKMRKELQEPSRDEQDLQSLVEEYNEVTTQLQRASTDKRLMQSSRFQKVMTLLTRIPLRSVWPCSSASTHCIVHL
jgi:HSP90 family molecular chaperone